VAKGPPISIEIVEEAEGRFVVTTFPDGEVVRRLVDPRAKPRKKPRKPYARAYSEKIDKTRKKRY
jgi:hypothetical protein